MYNHSQVIESDLHACKGICIHFLCGGLCYSIIKSTQQIYTLCYALLVSLHMHTYTHRDEGDTVYKYSVVKIAGAREQQLIMLNLKQCECVCRDKHSRLA